MAEELKLDKHEETILIPNRSDSVITHGGGKRLIMDIYGVKRFQSKIEKAFQKFNLHYQEYDEI